MKNIKLMRKYIFLILIVICSLSSLASNEKKLDNLSPYAHLFLMKYMELEQSGNYDVIKNPEFKDFVLRESKGNTFLSGLIELNYKFNLDAAKNLGVFFPSDLGDIKTFQVPVEHFKAFTNLEGINYLELDMPVVPLLDSAIKLTGIDKLRQGTNLPSDFTGKGVIVGIIDVGFDFTHPDYTNRIKRIWIQGIDGVPPQSYNYGSEIKIFNESSRQFDYDFITHGTHVTGIAAGEGKVNPNNKGAAPEADLVLVSYYLEDNDISSTGMSYILDAAVYIFNYALTHNQSAVINMSFGNHIGPHDGTSLFAKAADRISGPGRIICAAAGNSGHIPLHINYTFNQGNNIFSAEPELTSLSSGFSNYIDIWGNNISDFCVKVCRNDGVNTICSETHCASNDEQTVDMLPGGTGSVVFMSKKSDFNGKPRIFLVIKRVLNQSLTLVVEGEAGEINMWNAEAGGSSANGFYINSAFPNPIAGDNLISLNGVGAEGKNVIAVGAYNSKGNFININNNKIDDGWNSKLGDIAPFSSLGPTADRRTKPDITAPGNVVVSTLNSFTDFSYDEKTFLTDCHFFKNRKYCYGALSGTSMSSPLTAGTVALMLEANPYLDPQSTLSIIKSSAIEDAFTGDIPQSGDIKWGWGKLNAFESVKAALNFRSSATILANINFFPNPAETYINYSIDTTNKGNYEFLICDVLGREVARFIDKVDKEPVIKRLDIRKWSQGIYYVRVKYENSTILNHIIVKLRGSIVG